MNCPAPRGRPPGTPTTLGPRALRWRGMEAFQVGDDGPEGCEQGVASPALSVGPSAPLGASGQGVLCWGNEMRADSSPPTAQGLWHLLSSHSKTCPLPFKHPTFFFFTIHCLAQKLPPCHVGHPPFCHTPVCLHGLPLSENHSRRCQSWILSPLTRRTV